MVPYPQEIAQPMRQFYESLSEKDRRRYAGIEALRYGHGGRVYIAHVLGCSRRTVSKGAREVSGLPRAETERRIADLGAVANRTKPPGLTLTRNFCTCSMTIRRGTPWTTPSAGPI